MSLHIIHEIESIFRPGGPLSNRLSDYEFRPQQLEMASAVAHAFLRCLGRRHCLVEAGTGVGKSMAYLIPSVLYARTGKQVVISTHTIALQNQLVEKDIPLVQSILPDHPFKAVLMKGRANYLCRVELDYALQDISHQGDPDFERLVEWVKNTETGDVSELDFNFKFWSEVCSNHDTCRHKDCRYKGECFYYAMRARAASAHLVIANHALFFSDLALKQESADSGVLPSYNAVVFDEAHHLEDSAAKTFGIEFSNVRLEWLLKRVAKLRDLQPAAGSLESIKRASDDIFNEFSRFPKQEFFFEEFLSASGNAKVTSNASNLIVLLDNLNRELAAIEEGADEDLKERISGYRRMCSRMKNDLHLFFYESDPNYIKWCDKPQGRKMVNCCLHTTPVDVSGILRNTLWDAVDSAILTSATLSNSGGFEYAKSRLGIDDTLEEVLDSPFDYQRQCLLYVPADLEFPSEKKEYADAVAERIRNILEMSKGRAFVLFTSYRMLNAVFDRLQGRLPFKILKQGEKSNARLLSEFRHNDSSCLFGTHSFWEGVDVKGDSLTCVIIDKLPFSVPDSPINKARVDALIAAGRDWFKEYSVPQAQIRLKQGFGRLIRTKSDRGVVCIMDSRLVKKYYGKEFLQYLPKSRKTVNLDEVGEFLAQWE